MIQKNIDEITKEDLQSLIDNSISEHKTIEYKQSLSIHSVGERKEFLADVSSFANASGGDLIYGMSEKDGKPERIKGLNIEDIDAEILKLESMIRDCVEPRISGIISQPIKLSDSSKIVLIIRIPKSWNNPHRVSFKGHNKFYSRSTNGKYELDVGELRIAFNLSETITERIKKFRENRISKTFANETPIPFDNNAKIVLHLIPISSFHPAQNYDINKVASNPEKMVQLYGAIFYNKKRYNLDGLLTYAGSTSYIQLFRKGIIEAVDGILLKPKEGESLSIPSTYEKELVKSFPNYLSILKTLKVELPVFVFLTFIGVKGYSMSTTIIDGMIGEIHKIDRDILLLPEVVIENYDISAEDVLKPCFDSICNACGHSRSLNYDKNGRWKG